MGFAPTLRGIRRLIAVLALAWAAAVAGTACDLNPQPLPPDQAAGGSSSSGGGSPAIGGGAGDHDASFGTRADASVADAASLNPPTWADGGDTGGGENVLADAATDADAGPEGGRPGDAGAEGGRPGDAGCDASDACPGGDTGGDP
jgi:hypothetical protein